MLFKEFDNTGLLLASMLKRPFSDQLSHESVAKSAVWLFKPRMLTTKRSMRMVVPRVLALS